MAAISIVIPAYNEQDYIGGCLESVYRQIGPQDEVIVVDNNCSDQTVSIAKKWPVKVVKESRQGKIFARTTGMNRARHQIIARIDADTVLPFGWRQKVDKLVDSDGWDAISGPGKTYDLWVAALVDFGFFAAVFGSNRFWCGTTVLFGSNMLINKSAWQAVSEVQVLRDDIWEDFALSVELKKLGYKVAVDRDLWVWYSNRNGLKTAPFKAAAYQFMAPKTYWALGYRLNAVGSLIDKSLTVLLGMGLFAIEKVMVAIKGQPDRFYRLEK